MIRTAIYYTPSPSSAIAAEAARWLGRDPFTDAPHPQPVIDGIAPERFREITRSPRHYGFHGTLKPPFRLIEGCSITQLLKDLGSFAATRAAFMLPPLEIRYMHNFFCLAPVDPCPQLRSLAAKIVRHFDRFRAHPCLDELSRRRSADLTPEQDEMLLRWGYPYVLDEFRFHLTLTGKVEDEQEFSVLSQALQRRFASLTNQPMRLDTVSLFAEQDGSPMHVLAVFPLKTEASPKHQEGGSQQVVYGKH